MPESVTLSKVMISVFDHTCLSITKLMKQRVLISIVSCLANFQFDIFSVQNSPCNAFIVILLSSFDETCSHEW